MHEVSYGLEERLRWRNTLFLSMFYTDDKVGAFVKYLTERVETEPSRLLLEYWGTLPREKGIPAKADLDVVQMPRPLLPHLFLLEFDYSPFRAVFRLQGTFMTNSLGQSFTGKEIANGLLGHETDRVLQQMERLASSQVPYITKECLVSETGVKLAIEVVHLPLLDEEGKTSHLIGSLTPVQGNPSRFDDLTYSYWAVTDICEIT